MFSLLLTLGASITFLCANALGDVLRRPPQSIVGATAAVAAVATIVGLGDPKGSRWRVPAAWQKAGHGKFAGLFGFSLGLGFATSLPSIGFVVLILLSVAATSAYVALLLAFGFALGRVIPFLGVVVSNRERTQARLFEAVQRYEGVAIFARWAEVGLLLVLSASLLTSFR